jgi:hypothetical protein
MKELDAIIIHGAFHQREAIKKAIYKLGREHEQLTVAQVIAAINGAAMDTTIQAVD